MTARLPETSDPFVLLALSPAASLRELRTAYARRIKEFRPDRAPDEFARIQAAFETVRARLQARGTEPVLTQDAATSSHAGPRSGAGDRPLPHVDSGRETPAPAATEPEYSVREFFCSLERGEGADVAAACWERGLERGAPLALPITQLSSFEVLHALSSSDTLRFERLAQCRQPQLGLLWSLRVERLLSDDTWQALLEEIRSPEFVAALAEDASLIPPLWQVLTVVSWHAPELAARELTWAADYADNGSACRAFEQATLVRPLLLELESAGTLPASLAAWLKLGRAGAIAQQRLMAALSTLLPEHGRDWWRCLRRLSRPQSLLAFHLRETLDLTPAAEYRILRELNAVERADLELLLERALSATSFHRPLATMALWLWLPGILACLGVALRYNVVAAMAALAPCAGAWIVAILVTGSVTSRKVADTLADLAEHAPSYPLLREAALRRSDLRAMDEYLKDQPALEVYLSFWYLRRVLAGASPVPG